MQLGCIYSGGRNNGTKLSLCEAGPDLKEVSMDQPQNLAAGRLSAIWRYPVKSMIGEELSDGRLTSGGVLGDRAYALVDVDTGKVVSAKNPRRWPNLFE